MVESKFYNKKNNPKPSKQLPPILKKLLNQVLITAIITMIILIGFKWNNDLKQEFYKYVYNTSFPFASIKDWYQNLFGKDLLTKPLETETEVFEEKLSYSNQSLYKEGVALTVSDHYMIPSLNSGIVVFIGEKENYGNTIIIQQMNGIDAWYGNIDSASVQLYDYVEQGALIGETKDQTLYLAFQKEGNFVDYKEYIN